jgi:hypothetical protein
MMAAALLPWFPGELAPSIYRAAVGSYRLAGETRTRNGVTYYRGPGAARRARWGRAEGRRHVIEAEAHAWEMRLAEPGRVLARVQRMLDADRAERDRIIGDTQRALRTEDGAEQARVLARVRRVLAERQRADDDRILADAQRALVATRRRLQEAEDRRKAEDAVRCQQRVRWGSREPLPIAVAVRRSKTIEVALTTPEQQMARAG